MATFITRAAIVAVLGIFCLSIGLPAATIAQAATPSAAAGKSGGVMKKMAKKAAPSKSVMALQAALNQHGAKIKADGKMGRQTRAALKKFQAKNHLKATGKLDKGTRAKLGL